MSFAKVGTVLIITMSNARVIKSLYKSLSRLAINFDNNSVAKLLLYRKCTESTHKSAASVYYSVLLDRIMMKTGCLFRPETISCVSLRNVVKNEFRNNRRLFNVNDRTDAAFYVLRKASSIWNFYLSLGIEFKETSPDAQLSNDEPAVKLCENPFAGTFLIAHPLIQGALHRAVVFILEHNTEGTYGVVINHKEVHNLTSVVKGLPEDVVTAFSSSKVSFGGMVRRLQFIHSVPACGGLAIPMCSSKERLYAGGQLSQAISEVTADPKKIANFRFYAGCCIWDFDVLKQEIAAGYWTCVSSAPDQILRLVDNGSGQVLQPDAPLLETVTDNTLNATNSNVDIIRPRGVLINSTDGLSADAAAVAGAGASPVVTFAHDSQLEWEGGKSASVVGSPSKLSSQGGHVVHRTRMRSSSDLWAWMSNAVGGPHRTVLGLPAWLDTSSIESMDWR